MTPKKKQLGEDSWRIKSDWAISWNWFGSLSSTDLKRTKNTLIFFVAICQLQFRTVFFRVNIVSLIPENVSKKYRVWLSLSSQIHKKTHTHFYQKRKRSTLFSWINFQFALFTSNPTEFFLRRGKSSGHSVSFFFHNLIKTQILHL